MMRRTAITGALSLWIPTVGWAGTDILTIGDEAPAVDIAHWLKGSEVEKFEPGKVYVLEFWATWCSPCWASIPHLSDLQEQYQDYDVTFLGVSDEKLQKVVKFMSKADSENVLWNEKIHYTLATDPDGSTAKAYLEPAAQQFIPTAFIIGKDTRIEWIGSPMKMDEVLAEVVRDTWNRADFKVTFEKEIAPVREAMRLMDSRDTATERGDWDGAIEALDTLLEAQPDYSYLKTRLFRKMLTVADPAGTYEYGRSIMEAYRDDPNILNKLAWSTVDDEGVRSRNLEFALEAAQRANELTDEKSAGILDTLARVYYEKGDLEAAVKWQRKAVEQAENPGMAGKLRETLEKYQNAVDSRL